MKHLSILIFFALLLHACIKDDSMDPEDSMDNPDMTLDDDTLRIVWKTNLQEPGEIIRSGFNIISNQEFIFVVTEDAETGPRYLEKYDKESGEFLKKIDIDPVNTLYHDSNGLHVLRGPEYFLYDDDLNLIEENQFPIAATDITTIGTELFTSTLNGNHDFSSILHKKGTDAWDEVLNLESNDGWYRGYESPAIQVEQSGDTILYFFVRMYTFDGGYKEQVDFHAYNMTEENFIWSSIDFDPIGDVSVKNPPIIDGDRIYCVGKVSAYCFNRITGEKVWQRDFIGPEGFQSAPYYLKNDILYVRGSAGTLRGFDKNNGSVLFQTQNQGVSLDLHVDDKYVSYCNSKLYVSDSSNGENLYVDDKYNIFGNIEYNEDDRRIYTASSGRLICWEIPD